MMHAARLTLAVMTAVPNLARARRFCAVPGCGAAIMATSASGVCRGHNHAPDHCNCTACVKRRGRPLARATDMVMCAEPGCTAPARWQAKKSLFLQTCGVHAPKMMPRRVEDALREDMAAIAAARAVAPEAVECSHLYLNVLLIAVSDAIGDRAAVPRLQRLSAIDWFSSRDFVLVATFAGYDADYIRRLIGPRLAARRAEVAAQPPKGAS
jgi:hypothetical protein